MVNIMVKGHASRAIVCANNSILLMYRKIILEDGSCKEYYVTIGGGCEYGETFESALARELSEEAGIESFQINDIICDYYHDESLDDVNISRQISRMYLVSIDEGGYKQTIDSAGPESMNYSETNIYEIHELTRSDVLYINLKPQKLKEILIEYVKINTFIPTLH